MVSVQLTSSNTATVTLSSSEVAPYVWIETQVNGTWSDNGLTLFPDVQVKLNFKGWQTFTGQQLQSTLKIKSISDTL